MKRIAGLHWFIYPLFLMCCAKQTSPTGGPKDTIPPILVKSIPAKGSTNFNGTEIQLLFSEDVTLKNQKEQIIVTPDIGKEYKIEANKKAITIKLEEKLQDSTTYTFSFRDAVVDLNEQNPVQNLKLAFSTGDYIDSLSIEGETRDLLKSTELKDITVALYESDTFDIFKHKAVYITKSDKKGKFIIENLKPGIYRAYAIDDKNRNLFADSKSESYGFASDSIALNTNVKNVSIPIIKLDTRKLKISSARPYNTYFNIKATKSIVSYKIKSDEVIPFSTFGDDNASLKVFNTLFEKDSASINLNFKDSIGNEVDTLLYLKFNKQNTKPEKFDFTINDFRIIENKGLIIGRAKFNKPIFNINYDSIFYKIDSVTTIHFSKEDITIDTLMGSAFFQKRFDKGLLVEKKEVVSKIKEIEPTKAKQKEAPAQPKKIIEHQLYLGHASFISIESDSSKRIEQTLKPTKLDQTGILFVSIETKEPNFIVELLRKDFTLVETKYNQNKISFEDLPPGDYMIRLIIDRDKNKKWSPGNFFLHEEPEKIVFYKNEKESLTINLRANFEIDGLLIKY